jgi:uroporphyrinogen III methyltransferase/synthase
VGPESFDRLDATLRELAEGAYDWVVFLSANAVGHVIERLRRLGLEAAGIRGRVAAVGAATAAALSAAGVSVDLQPDTSSAAGVATALGAGMGRVLVPRAADAPADALEALRAQGWQVDEVTAYRTVLVSEGDRAEIVRKGGFDAITFTSGSTVRGFAAMVTPAEAGLAPDSSGARKVVCIGPGTARAATDLGFRTDAIAQEQSDEGLVQALLSLGWLCDGALWSTGMAR